MSRDKFTTLLVVISSIFVLSLCQNNAPLVWTEYNGIDSIAVDVYGTLYVSVPKENKIYELDSRDGSLLPYAGTGEAGFQDGEMYTALFNGPTGMVIDNQNTVIYICDTNNNAIRKIVAGMVHTIATNITSPISISIVNYSDRYLYGQLFVPSSPIGLYVLSEDGTVTILEDGPSNDNCAAATALNSPTSNIYVVGTLSGANYETGFYPCYHTQGRNEPEFPMFTVWYSFIGTGDRLNITITQQSSNSAYPALFLYRMSIPNSEEASCESLQCISWEYSQYFYPSPDVEGTITFCSQPEYVYYVAVSSNRYLGESSYYQPIFDLAVINLGSYGCDQCFCNVSDCSTNKCGGYCPDAPECQGENEICIFGTCFDRTPNADCNNAVALVGNTSYHGNTIKGVGPLMNIDWSGNCISIRNYGLWYKSVGTGLLTSLDTCNSGSGGTGLHLYLADDSVPCSTSLECVTNGEYCPNGAILYFCGIPDATYYIYVEASNTVADFVLTQTVFEDQECTPGNSYNLDSSFYFGYFSSYTSFFTSYIYW